MAYTRAALDHGPMHWKKILMYAAALLVVLKFRNQLTDVVSQVPLLGPIIRS